MGHASFARDIHIHAGYDSFNMTHSRGTRLIDMGHDPLKRDMAHSNETQLIRIGYDLFIRDMTHSYVT